MAIAVIVEGVEDMVPVDADPDLALAPVMCVAGLANELSAMNSANCRTLKLVISAGGFNDDKFHVFTLNQVAILVLTHPDLAVAGEGVAVDLVAHDFV